MALRIFDGAAGFEFGVERFYKVGSYGFWIGDEVLVPLAGVSDEERFVRRMERIWRLGAAVLARPRMRAPAGARDVCFWG